MFYILYHSIDVYLNDSDDKLHSDKYLIGR